MRKLAWLLGGWFVIESIAVALGEFTDLFCTAVWLHVLIYLSIAALFAIAACWKQIKLVFNPAHRIVQRAHDRLEHRREAFVKKHIEHLRPFIRDVDEDVEYDISKKQLTITLRSRRTWKIRILHCTDWLANHRLLSERAWRWIGARLGVVSRADRRSDD